MASTTAAARPRATDRAPGRRIAVVNQKGGVGKTTTTVSIAAAAAETGVRVLVVDLDPQASATRWLNVKAEPGLTVLEVIAGTATLDAVAQAAPVPGITVVPATIDLVGAERALGGEPGAEFGLRSALEASGQTYGLILFDCPPTLGLLAVNALVAATEVLVPVGARAMDLDGLTALSRTVALVAARLNPGLAITTVLATQVRAREVLSREVLAKLAQDFPQQLSATSIRHSVRLSEAPSAREPITIYDPTSAVAGDYRALTTALLAQGGTT